MDVEIYHGEKIQQHQQHYSFLFLMFVMIVWDEKQISWHYVIAEKF